MYFAKFCFFKNFERLKTLKIVGTTIKYKKNHRPSDFCIKSLFYDHHQNLNPILTLVRRE
ncbi:hypothetical protein B1J93_08305 [Leptospira kirschneri serovar Pomona]|uniref:Uncharacterized protein n=1 Tax=Leptospira kirschneri serovar Pomona TaxID=561005 RepID=A0A1T1DQV2_9LEPT|nr:hypothetical protein B1J93_08305 [Leptospira kirschneri serovar Pomona]